MWVESDRDDNLDRVLWESFEAKITGGNNAGRRLWLGCSYPFEICSEGRQACTSEPPEKMDKAGIALIQQSPFPTEKEKLESWELPPDDWKQQITAFTESLIPPDWLIPTASA